MSATKRRQAHAASPELSTPDPKRQRKRNDDTFFPEKETVQTTTELGMKIVKLLQRSVDKTGRNIALDFLELPDRDEYPDYYQTIAMPLSLNLIEDRLKAGKYTNMEQLESDLKRMVQNAKDYNDSKSVIFEDAERIRKALSNFMPKHNPAYLDKEYKAYPTPIPPSTIDRANSLPPAVETPTGGPSIRLKFGSKLRRQSQTVSHGESDVAEEEPNGTADDMERKQLELLEDLSNQENAINFEEKPSKREIPHYYKVIERPTAITDVRNMVERGKISDWETFAKEVRLIWSNAKSYNEPGSEIYLMAEELEGYFEAKLIEHGVVPKVSTKIKLTQKPKQQIKLKMGSSTPILSSATSTVVDSESLRRQKEETAQALSRATRGSSRSHTNGSTPAPATSSSLRRSVSLSEPNGVQADHVEVNGTSLAVAEAAAIIPPVVDAKLLPTPTGSTAIPTPAVHIDAQAAVSQPSLVNGFHAPLPVQPTRSIYAESDNPIERKFRDPGKGVEDALLGSVTFMTHPNLPNDPKWKLTRYASAVRTQTSYYIYLPHDHFYLRVVPSLTAEYDTRKTSKTVVTHNWQTISAANPVSATEPRMYEFRLNPGENTIAVDVIADLKTGERKEYAPPQLQVDFEQIMLFVYLRDREE